jgi:hypothetical protein
MTVAYHQRHGTEVPDYQCMRDCIDNAARRCQTIPGAAADAAIGTLLIDTLTPLTLEVALTVQAEIETRAAEADAMRASHVERTRHRADLARRRYLAVDPDNRLVATSLEADWNQALRTLQAAQDNYDNATARTTALTDSDKARIRALAADFPTLWSNPATPQRERKRMARLLIDDVTMTRTDQIHLHIRFRGGQTTSLAIPIPPPAWKPGKPLPKCSPCSTTSSTTTPTPGPPPPSTPPGTAPAKASPSPAGSCSTYAAATTCPATPTASAPAGCSPSPKPQIASASTPPPSRPGAAPACSPPTRPTTRTSRCSSHPTPPTPTSSNAKAASSPSELTPQPHQEVQYETHVLSRADPGRPMDWAMESR